MRRKDKQVFDTAVWQFYRGILCVPRGEEQGLTALMCYAPTGLPSPDTLLRACRVQYVCQLVRAGPDQLWAAIRPDRPYSEFVAADLRWMYGWIRDTSELGHPDQDWDSWLKLITCRPGRFKGLLNRACGLDQLRLQVAASLDGLHCCTAPSLLPAVSPRVQAGLMSMHGYRSRAHLVGAPFAEHVGADTPIKDGFDAIS